MCYINIGLLVLNNTLLGWISAPPSGPGSPLTLSLVGSSFLQATHEERTRPCPPRLMMSLQMPSLSDSLRDPQKEVPALRGFREQGKQETPHVMARNHSSNAELGFPEREGRWPRC